MIDLSKLKQAAEKYVHAQDHDLSCDPAVILELIARLEAAERKAIDLQINANRYRFLRQGGYSQVCALGAKGTAAFKTTDEALDELVDAGMAIDPYPRATDKKKMQQAIEKYGMKPGREWMPHSDGSYSPMDKSDIERIRNDDFLRRRKP